MTKNELMQIIWRLGEWQHYRKGKTKKTPSPSDFMQYSKDLDSAIKILTQVLNKQFILKDQKIKQNGKKLESLINFMLFIDF